jgi:hypothetical protein
VQVTLGSVLETLQDTEASPLVLYPVTNSTEASVSVLLLELPGTRFSEAGAAVR